MRRLGPVAAPLAIGAAILACVSPLTPSTLVPVETIVALTLQALTATPPLPSETSAPPAASPIVLPHDLYFVNRDESGLRQVFRIEADTLALRQITFETLDVDDYDVSSQDGSVAYTSNNQLYLVDAVGGGRTLLLDGGPVDGDNRWTNSIVQPLWSPDGQSLAFNHGGLSFLNVSTGASSRVLENQFDTSPDFSLIRELYIPNTYSPDGGKLLIDIAYYEGGAYALYFPSNNAVVRFTREDGGLVCCYVNWIPDGSGLYITSPSLGLVDSGLYFVDAATGVVTPLLPGAAPDGTYNFAWSAMPGPDGNLLFFFNNLPEVPGSSHTPLYLVRSAPDGVSDRTYLLPDPFENINEILWATDASLAVVVIAPKPDIYAGGEARVVCPDGRPAIVLASSAQDLHWGP